MVTFADSTASEQPSLALTYVLPGPPSKVLNLTATGGDAGLVASWGMPESAGSVAMLSGYDIEVADGDGAVVRTVEVAEPWAAIADLTNGVTYTIKVRAKTVFGVSDWERATATTQAVPPPSPGGGSACVLEVDTPSNRAARTSSAQAYLDRVAAYYQAQDAVLEGHADTIWDAPGVAPDAPSTAKLSLINATLKAEHQRLAEEGKTRSASAVQVKGAVVQALADGGVRVTAEVERTWTETSESVPEGRSAAGALGLVEGIESTITIHVFDRCGNVTAIEAPLPAYEDGSDARDPCSGFVHPDGTTEEVCGVSSFPTTTSSTAYIDIPIQKNFWARIQTRSQWNAIKAGPNYVKTTKEWKLDVFQNYMRLYTIGSNKEIWDTRTGQYVLKHIKMTSTGYACFTNVRYRQEIGVGFTVGIPMGVGLTVQSAKSNEVGQDCKASTEEYERAPDPNKYAAPKISNMPAYVQSYCDPEHLDECELNKFRHRMDANLTIWYPPEKNSNLQEKDVVRAAIVCRPLDFAGHATDGAVYTPSPTAGLQPRYIHRTCDGDATRNENKIQVTTYEKYIKPQ